MDFTWIDFRFSQWKSISWVTWKGYSPFFFDSYYVHSSIVTREGNPRLSRENSRYTPLQRRKLCSNSPNYTWIKTRARKTSKKEHRTWKRHARGTRFAFLQFKTSVFTSRANTNAWHWTHHVFNVSAPATEPAFTANTFGNVRHIPARNNTSKSNKKLSRTVNSHPIVARFW